MRYNIIPKQPMGYKEVGGKDGSQFPRQSKIFEATHRDRVPTYLVHFSQKIYSHEPRARGA